MFKKPRTHRSRRIFVSAHIASVMLLLGACASAPSTPPDSLAQASAAITAAEKEDASRYAAAELDEARQKLVSADRAFKAEDMILADRLAQEAAATAELAAVRTESAKAAAVNLEMRRGIEALTEEMRRAGDNQ